MQILKLGGSVLSRKHGFMQADAASIARLASIVGRAYKAGVRDLIIVHGAGSFGHAPVIKYKLNNGVRTRKQTWACALTHSACSHFSSHITDALIAAGVPAMSVPPADIARSRNRRIVFMDKKVVFDHIKAGYVPVLFGDMIPDSLLGCSVCSGDQIVSYFGKYASRVVMATNVDGVLVHGEVVPHITRGNFREISRHLKCSGAPDVTGGMEGKIREIMKCRAPAYIVNARKPARVLALLIGKKAISTRIN
ncbi:MAG: isopentenyl phosphate kinase [Candidatus Micrarchaeota archaeon]|nr:isopentenyl phosphate kinase [Candidatus Micrarchaeota archaeon]